MRLPRLRQVAGVVVSGLLLAGCSSGAPSSTATATVTDPAGSATTRSAADAPPSSTPAAASRAPRVAAPFRHRLPGMPPVLPGGVYAAARGRLPARVAHDPAYLYVPNSSGAPITTVIDQRTRKVVRVLHTGTLSQHVTPSWDLRTLYVEASAANQLVALDPATGRVERRIPQRRPYNLYFTPDGRQAVVMAEQDDDIVFTDPHSFRRHAVVHDPSCEGPNHADFSANGRSFVVTCEFSGSLLEVSTLTHRVLGRLHLPAGSKPQDVRLAPDGRSFYVADMGRDRLLRVGWRRLRVVGHTDLPSMPHGIYPSRDGRRLYVSDRMAGEVSVVSVATGKVVDTWSAPGSHPDMGGVSADGRTLWLSGRYDGYVYGWDTRSGRLVAKIAVGGSPHGLLVWPQPGRYSLGHTGNLR
ncbi:MAG: beta-propeller fold lactonase family protein [Nocardioidaceae bacterium]